MHCERHRKRYRKASRSGFCEVNNATPRDVDFLAHGQDILVTKKIKILGRDCCRAMFSPREVVSRPVTLHRIALYLRSKTIHCSLGGLDGPKDTNRLDSFTKTICKYGRSEA